MDYKQQLYRDLLAQSNLNYLSDMVFSIYKISRNDKTSMSCMKELSTNLKTLLDSLKPEDIPKNNDQFVAARNLLKIKLHLKDSKHISKRNFLEII